MITREVRLGESAQRDIEILYDYIVQHDGIAAAEHVYEALEDCWKKLATFSERGNVPRELVDEDRRYRELHWKPYRIIYRIDPKIVTVYAVVDGRRNLRTFLRERFGHTSKKNG